MNRIVECIVTVFYIGKSRIAPGTLCSLFTFPIFYIFKYFCRKLAHFLLTFQLVTSEFYSSFFYIYFLDISITVVCFFLGIYFVNIYIIHVGIDDPGEVVIDELTGQMLVISVIPFLLKESSIFYIRQEFNTNYFDFFFFFFIPFFLFRIFDILKPWPIKWFDSNVRNSFGVMIDDVIAALFTVSCQYIIFLSLFFIFSFH